MKRKRILSIDDEPALLKCFADALRPRGYEVLTASDPERGLAILRADAAIDLLMLDIKMPGKSGFDVYREFRQFGNIPVLFVTAYPKSFDASSASVARMWQEQFADGVTDILYKPFDLRVLFEKVEGLIGPAQDAEPAP